MARRFPNSASHYQSTPPVTAVPLTLSVRFRADSAGVQNLMFLSNVGVTQGWGMYLDGSGKLHGYVAASSASDFVTSTNYSAATWHHACLVCESDTSRTVYLDGGGATTNTDTRSVTGASVDAFRVGWFLSGLVGSVADVGVWAAALTEGEVRSLSNGVSCRRVRPGSLRFCAPLIRDVIDTSGARNIIDLNGDTVVATHPRVYP
jgi:hypothetical protein